MKKLCILGGLFIFSITIAIAKFDTPKCACNKIKLNTEKTSTPKKQTNKKTTNIQTNKTLQINLNNKKDAR